VAFDGAPRAAVGNDEAALTPFAAIPSAGRRRPVLLASAEYRLTLPRLFVETGEAAAANRTSRNAGTRLCLPAWQHPRFAIQSRPISIRALRIGI